MSTDAVLRALAEPNRRAILRLVRDTPLSVSQIAAQVDITQQAVSLHVKTLREAGLLRVSGEGRRRLYLVDPDGFSDLQEFLGELWPAALTRLKFAVEAGTGDRGDRDPAGPGRDTRAPHRRSSGR